MTRPDAFIVGTAGHIDHGKTSLVKGLSGVFLDKNPEELARGITIELGFTQHSLPSGRRVSFVDVPGHERFVRTMIAGAHGIDAVLLCVSAVEGVMPQTEEHLSILQTLGVTQGAVVLTFADLVDEELLELAQEELRETLLGTALEGAPILVTSSETGLGLAEVVQALEGFTPRPRAAGSSFRLPIDRAFTRDGFGTIVTGTVMSGAVRTGQSLKLSPGDEKVRVRGLEHHGETVEEVRAGMRVAVNIAGVDRQELGRGAQLNDGGLPTTSVLDVLLGEETDLSRLYDGMPIRFLVGTAEVMGRVYFPGEDPGSFAQVRLQEPLSSLPGDRFVLRRSSPLETLGGGQVLDPWAKRLKGKHSDLWRRELQRLQEGDERVWLERAGEEGLTPAQWAMRSSADEGVILGPRRVATPVAARLTGIVLSAMAAFHTSNPLQLGCPRRGLRTERLQHLPEEVYDALIHRLATEGLLALEGPLVRAPAFRITLTKAQKSLQQQILTLAEERGYEGLDGGTVRKSFSDSDAESLMRLAEREGDLVEIRGLGCVTTARVSQLRAHLKQHFEGQSTLTPAQFKEVTGLTRKGAIPWLEWLDAQGWTERKDGSRSIGPVLSS